MRPRTVAEPVTLGDHVVRLVKLMAAARQQAPREHSVDPTAYPLLFNLVGGPRRVSELADCVHADISTVSRHASTLSGAGLLDKVPDPHDGRAQLLRITPAGLAHLVTVQDRRDQWLDDLLADWSATDRATFTSLLARFGDAVERSLTTPLPPRPGIPLQAAAPHEKDHA